jgi:hypothetical protein
MTEANFKSEINQIIQIFDVCNSIKNDYFDYTKKQVEESNQKNKRDENLIVVPVVDKERKPKLPNVQHFGGKMPFGVDNNDDPFADFKKNDNFNGVSNDLINEFRKGENNNNNNNNFDDFGGFNNNKQHRNRSQDDYDDYVIYKKPSVNNDKKDKDPMVWDPPEEKPKSRVVNSKPAARNNNIRPQVQPQPGAGNKKPVGSNKAQIAKLYEEAEKKGAKKKDGKDGKVESTKR